MGQMMSMASALTGHAKLPPEATIRYTIDTTFEGADTWRLRTLRHLFRSSPNCSATFHFRRNSH